MATCGARFRKPVDELISDRAKRYRANTPECRPRGKKICEYCSSRKNVEVHHRDGHESNTKRSNLAWACRSCNTKIGKAMARRGQGSRVSQTNPADSMAQWVSAVLSAKGESDAIPKDDAIEIIHATPASDRSRFAREIWKRRRRTRRNPTELLIFGNPKGTKKNAGSANHKPNCKCFACKYRRGDKNLTPQQTKAAGGRTNKKRVRPTTVHRSRGTRHRNPQLSETRQAVKLFSAFHGADPKDISEKQESAAMRLDYTSLGDLIALGLGEPELHGNRLVTGWDKCPHIGFKGDGVKLASAPNGKQLYLIGGTQDISAQLENWEGVDPEKDFIDLGDCGFVVYLARKVHGGFKPVEWCHEFGERKSTLPRLMYDSLKKRIFLVGGESFIDDSKEISPGIEG
jgi:hypothetical protein